MTADDITEARKSLMKAQRDNDPIAEVAARIALAGELVETEPDAALRCLDPAWAIIVDLALIEARPAADHVRFRGLLVLADRASDTAERINYLAEAVRIASLRPTESPDLLEESAILLAAAQQQEGRPADAINTLKTALSDAIPGSRLHERLTVALARAFADTGDHAMVNHVLDGDALPDSQRSPDLYLEGLVLRAQARARTRSNPDSDLQTAISLLQEAGRESEADALERELIAIKVRRCEELAEVAAAFPAEFRRDVADFLADNDSPYAEAWRITDEAI